MWREPLIFAIYCKSLLVLVVARPYLHFNFLEHISYRERMSKEIQSLVAWLKFNVLCTYMFNILTRYSFKSGNCRL